jgi:ABC-type Co2+ transport system permease subunit
MHPLLHLVANQPQLLADHAQAYAELAAVQVARLSADWKRRVLLAMGTLCGLVVASVLAGVALMLWSVMPAVQPSWILIATPVVPAVLAACCLVALRRQYPDAAAHNLWQQVKADMRVLRAAAGA